LGFRWYSRQSQAALALVALGVISACGSPGGAKPSAQAVTISHDTLTSLGATTAAWNAHHQASAPDSNVTQQGGRVVEYTVNTGAISIAAAIKRAKQQLPSDTRQIWAAARGNCYQVELTSSTLGRALSAPEIGDSAGGVLAIINTLLPDGASTYHPTGVNQIMLSPGSYPEPADAPDC
jgi:hypothetical protein